MKRVLKGVKKKPFFSDEKFYLYQNDSIDFLKSLPENSIDMIFADPPYNLSNGGFTVHAGKRVSVNKGDWDESKGVEADFGFHVRWLEECHRVLKPEGTIWVSGTYHSIYQCGYALQILGYKILNEISWFKPNAAPNLSGRYFAASHETLIWARKDPKAKHTFNYQVMKNGPWHSGDEFKNDGRQMRSVWSMGYQSAEDNDIWVIGTPKPGEKKLGKHPTQKPISLLERVILASTNEGDIILDPFTGSSTTGIVAAEFNRKFIGIDLEKEYLILSKKRYENLNQILL